MNSPSGESQEQAYFQLADTCHLVEGPARSVVYDTQTGDAYHLQPGLSRLIHALKDGVPLPKAVETVPCSVEEGREALKVLTDHGIGDFGAQSLPTASELSLIPEAPSPSPQTLYAEMTGDCTLNCRFCQPGAPTINRLQGCHRWPRAAETPELPLAEWQSAIDAFSAAGYAHLALVGGDPLLRWNRVLDLIEYTRECGIGNITLETNGTELTPERIDRLHERAVHLLIPFPGFDPEVFDLLVGVPGTFHKLFQNLEYLLRAKAEFSIRVPVCDANQDQLREIIQTMISLGAKHVSSFPILGPPGKPLNPWCRDEEVIGAFYNEEMFSHAQGHEICWADQAYITATGDLIPCLHARHLTAGNVRHSPPTTLVDPLEQLKRNIGEEQGVCSRCEFRLGCRSCPLLAYRQYGSFQAPDPRCTYDPEAGRWTAAE